MDIDVKINNTEIIRTGDLVLVNDEYRLVIFAQSKYMLLNLQTGRSCTKGYNTIEELIDMTGITLVASKESLLLSRKADK